MSAALAIFTAMRVRNPFASILRAVLWAAIGLTLSAGMATAHQGHISAVADGVQASTEVVHRSQAHGTVSDQAQAEDGQQAMSVDHGDLPCSSGGNPGHFSGSCCTVACHAALTVIAPQPFDSHELPLQRVATWIERLEGRSSDRTERPPKIG